MNGHDQPANPQAGNATTDATTTPRPLPLPVELGVLLPLGALANLFDPKSHGNPRCVARGRDELEIAVNKVAQHLSTAKGTGQLAIAFGVPLLQRKLVARIDAARGRPLRPEPDLGEWPGTDEVNTQAQVTSEPPLETVRNIDHPTADGQTACEVSVDAEALAIPGYDTLSASQIVERLGGLSQHDRDMLRGYEIAHRNRRTVLGKIDQLQATGS